MTSSQLYTVIALTAAGLCGRPAAASGTGILPFSDPVAAVKSSVGSRQLLDLTRSDNILIGKPRYGAIALITIEAPGYHNGRILIREREDNNSATLLQLIAPSELQRTLKRATLFVWTGPKTVRLAHAFDRQWIEVSPQNVSVPGVETIGDKMRRLTAFQVERLGLFQLVSAGPSIPVSFDGEPAAFGAFDIDVKIARAGWHLVWPALTLLLAGLLSRHLHRRAEHR
jgi:hypothetical protein